MINLTTADFKSELMHAVSNTVNPADMYDRIARSDEARERIAEWESGPRGADSIEFARRALLPAALHVQSEFTDLRRQWTKLFRKVPGTVDVERKPEISWTRLAQLRARGTRPARDNGVGERFLYQSERHDIALQTALSNDFLDDAGGPTNIGMTMLGMAESFLQTEEILHANVFNTGRFYNPSIIGDGQPLFSERHPHDHGYYSNIFSGGYLNETAIELACSEIARFPMANGLRKFAVPEILVVPIPLEFVAHRIMTCIRDPRPPRFPTGYAVLDFLDDEAAWFITTSVDGLISTQWQPFRLDLLVEDNALVLDGSQSYTPTYTDPRAVFGNFPKDL